MWLGFVKKNIFVKNTPKENDKIVILNYSHNYEEYSFLKFYDEYRSLQVKSDSGRIFHYNVDRIKELNGEPYELDFYIKWKGKTYGID